ncbi:hypothetical protein AVEN_62957-1 [Araneus ventricosus]|uniref:Uncharacterized protein n=1 Tax=Araneus ventricosus TaxID=182803 RepID=A0A4Y2PFL6_ARAVE|nr:hypothetical protein AVEN_62957-1 [Araneus ventricosus]
MNDSPYDVNTETEGGVLKTITGLDPIPLAGGTQIHTIIIPTREARTGFLIRWPLIHVLMVGGIYRVPTKVPYHPFNFRMAATIFMRVVSRHGKVTMSYWMKPLTAPPGGKRWS